jgi:hypothetical protein
LRRLAGKLASKRLAEVLPVVFIGAKGMRRLVCVLACVFMFPLMLQAQMVAGAAGGPDNSRKGIACPQTGILGECPTTQTGADPNKDNNARFREAMAEIEARKRETQATIDNAIGSLVEDFKTRASRVPEPSRVKSVPFSPSTAFGMYGTGRVALNGDTNAMIYSSVGGAYSVDIFNATRVRLLYVSGEVYNCLNVGLGCGPTGGNFYLFPGQWTNVARVTHSVCTDPVDREGHSVKTCPEGEPQFEFKYIVERAPTGLDLRRDALFKTLYSSSQYQAEKGVRKRWLDQKISLTKDECGFSIRQVLNGYDEKRRETRPVFGYESGPIQFSSFNPDQFQVHEVSRKQSSSNAFPGFPIGFYLQIGAEGVGARTVSAADSGLKLEQASALQNAPAFLFFPTREGAAEGAEAIRTYANSCSN